VAVARVGKHSKRLGSLHIYKQQAVYNSQLFVFHSTRSNALLYGYATNWNRNSWEEYYPEKRKLNIHFCQQLSWFQQKNITIYDPISFYINAKFVSDIRHIDIKIGPLKRN
jgi:hypothetical protein